MSVIGGGKFANGAIAAAWVNLFNDQAARMARRNGEPCPALCHGTESPDRIPMPDSEQVDMAKSALLVVAGTATGPFAGSILAAPRVIDMATKVDTFMRLARARTYELYLRGVVASSPVTMNPTVHQRMLEVSSVVVPGPPQYWVSPVEPIAILVVESAKEWRHSAGR